MCFFQFKLAELSFFTFGYLTLLVRNRRTSKSNIDWTLWIYEFGLEMGRQDRPLSLIRTELPSLASRLFAGSLAQWKVSSFEVLSIPIGSAHRPSLSIFLNIFLCSQMYSLLLWNYIFFHYRISLMVWLVCKQMCLQDFPDALSTLRAVLHCLHSSCFFYF